MEEKDLIRLSQEGSQEAFSSLVEKYKKRVFHLALSMTRNREVADDLAQEAFIKAYLALPKFRFQSEFGTWLYRIAINLVKDHLRKIGKRKEISLEGLREQAAVLEGEDLRREQNEIEERRRNLVHEILQSLPLKHQVILALRDIQGNSYEEIARILNISPGTVDSRLHRARKLLRRKIEPFLIREGGRYAMSKI
jgi:RNA polymerase sigma-70 factor (ECF subfamily)